MEGIFVTGNVKPYFLWEIKKINENVVCCSCGENFKGWFCITADQIWFTLFYSEKSNEQYWVLALICLYF